MSFNHRKLISSVHQSISSLQKIIDSQADDDAEFNNHIQSLTNVDTDNVDFMSTDFDVHSIPREHVELSIGFYKEWNKDRIQGKKYQERDALNNLKRLVTDLEESLNSATNRDSKSGHGDVVTEGELVGQVLGLRLGR
jgi:hypothetical protein